MPHENKVSEMLQAGHVHTHTHTGGGNTKTRADGDPQCALCPWAMQLGAPRMGMRRNESPAWRYRSWSGGAKGATWGKPAADGFQPDGRGEVIGTNGSCATGSPDASTQRVVAISCNSLSLALQSESGQTPLATSWFVPAPPDGARTPPCTAALRRRSAANDRALQLTARRCSA